MKTVNVGIEFYPRLANRNTYQGDGRHNAIEFRKKYLSFLDNSDAWLSDEAVIKFDFDAVKKIGPSFANEAFAYFIKYASPDVFLKKVLFVNWSRVQEMIIKEEIESAYKSS